MATVGDVIDDILSTLQGYTRTLDQTTHVTAAVGAADLTWSVGDATQVSRGLAEIGSELVWVDSVNRTANTITVAPYGRGYQGTTAAAHTANTRLVFTPVFPRIRVFNALNDTLQAVDGQLFSIGRYTFTFQSAVTTYDLPESVSDVLSVAWELPGTSQEWLPVRRWRFESEALTKTYEDTYPSSIRKIVVYDAVLPGRTVQVIATDSLIPYTSEANDAATFAGLPPSAVDVLRFGALSRLVSGLDAVRIAPSAVSVNQLDDKGQVGNASALSRQFYQMHKQRLEEERSKLLVNYPTTIHYQR